MTKKIIFSAGGTGGHIIPAINLMKHFFENGYNVLLVTDSRGKRFVNNLSEFKSYTLHVETLTNKNLIRKFLSLPIIFFSILKSIFIIKKENPDMVFGFGGYVSFPISFASNFFKLPLIIYENNMILGRTNKFLSLFAKKILLAKKINEKFSEKNKKKSYQVGSILGKNIVNYSSFKDNKKKGIFSVLVLGGSQGAEIFGNIVPSVIKEIKDKGYKIQVFQQCIKQQKTKIIDFYEKNKVEHFVFEFNKDILKLILSSDLAITRCGASTTAELAHTCTPFVAVPIQHSIDNHQYLNAKYYEKKGCCWILSENDFNFENLFKLIIKVVKNENKLKEIYKNMKKENSNDVYSNIENEVKEFILK